MPPTQEQLQNRLTATGGTVPQPAVAPQTFAMDTLQAPTPQPLAAQQVTPTLPFPVAQLDATPPPIPDLAPTTGEQQASRNTQELMTLQKRLVGESAFRTEQETAQGLPALQQTQQDLAARLSAIQAEAQAIPLQLQQEAQGRGITAGGLAPVQASALRKNAIQALTTSALLEASRGNITLAQDNIQRAVAQRFDPIREEIAVRRSNLELLLADPTLTVEQQNRANKQLQLQDGREREMDKQEAAQKAVGEVALVAAQNGADSATLRRIQNSATAADAAIAAGEFIKEVPDAVKQQFISGTKTQAPGVFNPVTGEFRATGPIPSGTGAAAAPVIRINEFGQTIQGTTPPKAPSQGESQNFTFFTRMEDATGVFDQIQAEVDKLGLKGQVQLKFPAILQPEVLQVYSQAQRQFTEARLRKDSGAAIPPSEFRNDALTYFPQPGDGQETLVRKQAAREVTLSALRSSSGNAYWDFFGENPIEVGQRELQQGVEEETAAVTGEFTGPSGRKFNLPN